MRPLTLEIHGTGSHNRGAELMAIAIADRMRATFPGVRIVVPSGFGPYEARARHGFMTTTEMGGPLATRLYARYMPASIRKRLGVVHPDEVDVVLDASGFSFSDQWGATGARRLLEKMQQPSRGQQLLILMPQALGPFLDPEVSTLTRSLIRRAKLVYARDATSYNHAAQLLDGSSLRCAPDFTLAVPPMPVNVQFPDRPFIAIVPNARMLDKGPSAEAYLGFLRHAIDATRQQRFAPVFVLHDAVEDANVVRMLGKTYADVTVLTHEDPRAIKYMLGRAAIVIGSRFHALVSALSQGVPSIGTGWSHKYEALFEDFDCSDFLVRDIADHGAIDRLLGLLSSDRDRQVHAEKLAVASTEVNQRNAGMWLEVERSIRSHLHLGRRSPQE